MTLSRKCGGRARVQGLRRHLHRRHLPQPHAPLCLAAGHVCRPYVESLYPFLDCDMLAMRDAVRPEWLANKRLYVEIYTRQCRRSARCQAVLAVAVHDSEQPAFPGQGSALRHRAGRLEDQLRHAESRAAVGVGCMQWARWLAFNGRSARARARSCTTAASMTTRRSSGYARHRCRAEVLRHGLLATAAYCGHYKS